MRKRRRQERIPKEGDSMVLTADTGKADGMDRMTRMKRVNTIVMTLQKGWTHKDIVVSFVPSEHRAAV
jgi:hypothetical protein